MASIANEMGRRTTRAQHATRVVGDKVELTLGIVIAAILASWWGYGSF
jgi:hypothetical protein